MKRYWLASTCFVGLSVLGGAAAVHLGAPCPWYQRAAGPARVPPTPADPPGTRTSFPTPNLDSPTHTADTSPLRDITANLPAHVTIRPVGPARDALARVLTGKAPGVRVFLHLDGVRPLAAHGCTLRVFLAQSDATADTAALRPHWCATVGVIGARATTFGVDVTEGLRELARAKKVAADGGEVPVAVVLVEGGANDRQSVWVERVALRVEE